MQRGRQLAVKFPPEGVVALPAIVLALKALLAAEGWM